MDNGVSDKGREGMRCAFQENCSVFHCQRVDEERDRRLGVESVGTNVDRETAKENRRRGCNPSGGCGGESAPRLSQRLVTSSMRWLVATSLRSLPPGSLAFSSSVCVQSPSAFLL